MELTNMRDVQKSHRVGTLTRRALGGLCCLSVFVPACAIETETDPSLEFGIGETQQEVCSAGGLSLSANSGPVGTVATLTANAAACGMGENPEYRFFARDPGTGNYAEIQGWSADNTVDWDSTAQTTGIWRFQAWVRDDATTVTLDDYDGGYFILNSDAECTAASLSPGHGATIHAADTGNVGFTAGSTCAGTDNYRFWHLPPGGAWTSEQAYSADNTWTFSTSGENAGWHNFQVWVRNSGSSNNWEQAATSSLKLLTPCSDANFSFDMASPQTAGPTIAVAGSATCSGTATYKFYQRRVGETGYEIVQDWSANDTYSWNTSGITPGTYQFQIWVRNSGSGQTQEDYRTTSTFEIE